MNIAMFTDDDLLPLSALQHLLFCPRQCALIHVEQLWEENRLTVEGRHLHEKADRGRSESRPGVRIARGLPLRCFRLGLIGKADVVEFRPPAGAVPSAEEGGQRESQGREGAGDGRTEAGDGGGEVLRKRSNTLIPFPVEYKRGKPKPHDADRVQLCAQAICLEEMLAVPVPAGALFYGVTRRRLDVTFDSTLRSTTEDLCRQLRTMIDSRTTPPAVREAKCDNCSLLNLCMPSSLRTSASAYLTRSLARTTNTLPPGKEDSP
ncbi:MAG TPA: CRISPR-associated protein Cas4 [Phycisphaerae bacterium]|nr:CRISPR-associated protein Cas4 [Phycisphaerae bacterium]